MHADLLKVNEPPRLIREQAFTRLRIAIITGHFKPGERLIERELCEAMGVSRTSIREVLRRLEAERLVFVEPRRGPTVATVNLEQAKQIYLVRAQLEGILLARFTEMASSAEVQTLDELAEEFAEHAGCSDVMEMVMVMGRFYDHIIAVTHFEVIGDIQAQLAARVSYLRATSMSQPGRAEHSVEEIREIVAAVKRCDPNAASQAAVEHVNNACAVALERISS